MLSPSRETACLSFMFIYLARMILNNYGDNSHLFVSDFIRKSQNRILFKKIVKWHYLKLNYFKMLILRLYYIAQNIKKNKDLLKKKPRVILWIRVLHF